MNLRSAVFLGCASLIGVAGWSQTPASAVQTVTPAPAPEDTAKQIAAMEKKLDDWPQLGRYKADNAALGPAGQDEQRVVFYGDSITDGWGRRPDTGSFFQGSLM